MEQLGAQVTIKNRLSAHHKQQELLSDQINEQKQHGRLVPKYYHRVIYQ